MTRWISTFIPTASAYRSKDFKDGLWPLSRLAGSHPLGDFLLAQSGIDPGLDEFSRQFELRPEGLELLQVFRILSPLLAEFGERNGHGPNSFILNNAVRVAAFGVFRAFLRNACRMTMRRSFTVT